MPKPQTSTQSIQGHITVLILLVYVIHPPLNLFFIIPITHPQPFLDQENYIHTQHYFQIPPTQYTNNPSDHTGEFPKGVGHRVENGWVRTKVAVVLLNGLIW